MAKLSDGKPAVMKSVFKLIRLPNLVIIAATQYLMRHGVISPLLDRYDHAVASASFAGEPGFELQLPEGHFLLLILSTILITAAGYVINDYFDTRIDMLNRPGSVVVGTVIPRRLAMLIHMVLNVVGVGMGVYLSFYVGKPLWSIVFFLVAGMLWFYSTTYKRQFLIGNLLVAVLTALVPFMVALFEIPLLNQAYAPVLRQWNASFDLLVYWILGFSFFAFITTLTREIIKDVEDFEGDRTYGHHSLPIVMGVTGTRIVITVLIAITMAALGWVYVRFLRDTLTLVYMIVLVSLPLVFTGITIWIARTPEKFHLASIMMKGVMAAGVLYAIVVRYIIYSMF